MVIYQDIPISREVGELELRALGTLLRALHPEYARATLDGRTEKEFTNGDPSTRVNISIEAVGIRISAPYSILSELTSEAVVEALIRGTTIPTTRREADRITRKIQVSAMATDDDLVYIAYVLRANLPEFNDFDKWTGEVVCRTNTGTQVVIRSLVGEISISGDPEIVEALTTREVADAVRSKTLPAALVKLKAKEEELVLEIGRRVLARDLGFVNRTYLGPEWTEDARRDGRGYDYSYLGRTISMVINGDQIIVSGDKARIDQIRKDAVLVEQEIQFWNGKPWDDAVAFDFGERRIVDRSVVRDTLQKRFRCESVIDVPERNMMVALGERTMLGSNARAQREAIIEELSTQNNGNTAISFYVKTTRKPTQDQIERIMRQYLPGYRLTHKDSDTFFVFERPHPSGCVRFFVTDGVLEIQDFGRLRAVVTKETLERELTAPMAPIERPRIPGSSTWQPPVTRHQGSAQLTLELGRPGTNEDVWYMWAKHFHGLRLRTSLGTTDQFVFENRPNDDDPLIVRVNANVLEINGKTVVADAIRSKKRTIIAEVHEFAKPVAPNNELPRIVKEVVTGLAAIGITQKTSIGMADGHLLMLADGTDEFSVRFTQKEDGITGKINENEEPEKPAGKKVKKGAPEDPEKKAREQAKKEAREKRVEEIIKTALKEKPKDEVMGIALLEEGKIAKMAVFGPILRDLVPGIEIIEFMPFVTERKGTAPVVAYQNNVDGSLRIEGTRANLEPVVSKLPKLKALAELLVVEVQKPHVHGEEREGIEIEIGNNTPKREVMIFEKVFLSGFTRVPSNLMEPVWRYEKQEGERRSTVEIQERNRRGPVLSITTNDPQFLRTLREKKAAYLLNLEGLRTTFDEDGRREFFAIIRNEIGIRDGLASNGFTVDFGERLRQQGYGTKKRRHRR